MNDKQHARNLSQVHAWQHCDGQSPPQPETQPDPAAYAAAYAALAARRAADQEARAARTRRELRRPRSALHRSAWWAARWRARI